MTEHEWLTCRTAPMAMFRHVGKSADARKCRLIAVHCARIWSHAATPLQLEALDACEEYAESRMTEEQLSRFDSILYTESLLHGPDIAANEATHMAVASALYGGIRGLERCIGWVQVDAFWDISPEERQAALDRTRARVCELFREVIGNPFRLWASVPEFLGGGVVQPDGAIIRLSSTASSLAESIHTERAYDRLPILADSLEECGITDTELLTHCRDGTGHVRGCWALDVVRGKV